jgi:Fe2+ transport system protein B
MKNYNYQDVDKLIENYINKGGEAIQTREGILGSGDWVLTSDTLSSFIIKEVYVNCWNSTHTIKRYNKLPKKYLSIIN